LAHTLEPVGSSGSTVLLLVAAVLWLMYLVPLWLKRSEYYATERNAARLGQTIRLLANTSEASKEIRAELQARSIAKKEREAKHQLKVLSSPVLSLAERRRRTKQVFSLALLVGITSAATAYLAGWPLQVIWSSTTVVTISFAILGRLNRVSKDAMPAVAAAHQRAGTPRTIAQPPVSASLPPLPEPLSNRSVTEHNPLPSHDDLVRAARAAALAKRPEDFAHEELAVVSPFAAMGQVRPSATEKVNLDEVLRRRRAV
jgi:hypothetical protein